MNQTVGLLPFTCVAETEASFLVYVAALLGLSTSAFVFAYLAYALFWWDAHNLQVSATIIITSGFVYTIKQLMNTARPLEGCMYWETGSTPSYHTTMAAFGCVYYIYCFLMYADWPLWVFMTRSVLLIVYTGMVAAARVELRISNMADIVSGMLVGSWSALLFIYVQRRRFFAKPSLKSE